MAAVNALTIPQAFKQATREQDFVLMRTVSESLFDLIVQLEQLESDHDKLKALEILAQQVNECASHSQLS